MKIELLKNLGFSDKSAAIYMALLKLGPSSVRTLATYCELNRGTTYDALKWLQEQKVVSFYHKDTKQHFVAVNPEALHTIVLQKEQALQRFDKELTRCIPELQALYHSGGEQPIARYYSHEEIPRILEDVLMTCEQLEDYTYRMYSVSGIREYLYDGFPTFSDVRISKNIRVKVIAIGKGGELRGLDERKWFDATYETPTSILMYGGKTAYISLNAKKEPVGVVIENKGVYETQKVIFDRLWQTL
ncbi:MAG: hypothetical protein HN726_03360 [Candidatus Magasanikbacteria bacterium]|jgi:HTH-type transcriptional regulator, sugar sensing transcriptional regulator|nr:hypothetical protein [Candidatus Magasanikbacteria bacterium]MBT4221190.1 hypothetical protein [Candidatus Magasanikbacteria bacterium]MBT4350032.1 hypothetical protein [Candidatus Magasanikbacteria bacterium]MBT4541990.1 hypothetical protein [Candidatus Magasanikbacteria bacterium]MBT6252745.1 hypothetical protein [Candidatus Magasanikbacteria bacterium]